LKVANFTETSDDFIDAQPLLFLRFLLVGGPKSAIMDLT
jgi:hypothetical protein